MPDLSFTIGQLKITPFFWSVILAFIISSFSFWRRLREDYREEEIFGLTLFILAGSLLFTWVSAFVFGSSRPFFSLAFLGAVLSVKLWSLRFKVNIWEVFDALSLPLLFFLLLGGIGSFLRSGNFWDWQYFGVAILGLGVWKFSKEKYRSFSWYKSGKIGFLLWGVSFIVFLLLSLLAFVEGNALYFELLILVFIALFSAVMIYLRAERNFSEDWRNILKWRK